MTTQYKFALDDQENLFEELPTYLEDNSDPFLCIMLSGMNPKKVFEDYEFEDKDLMLYHLNAEEIAHKIHKGDKLTEQAQLIVNLVSDVRDYYQARFVEEKLRGKTRQRPEFSKDLLRALDIKGRIEPDFVGLYNKVIDMYNADKAWDMFSDTCKSAETDFDTFRPVDRELKFYTSVHGVNNKSFKNRRINYTRFYFVDSDRHLYEYSIVSNNPLRPFLENYFQTFNDAGAPWKNAKVGIRKVSSPVPMYKDEFMYYKIHDWHGLSYTQGENNGSTTA